MTNMPTTATWVYQGRVITSIKDMPEGILDLSKKDNAGKNWEKRILEFVPNKKLLTYYETKYLFLNEVLENKYNTHINDNILGKFFTRDFGDTK